MCRRYVLNFSSQKLKGTFVSEKLNSSKYTGGGEYFEVFRPELASAAN
jgi:hypothetical protein